MVSFKLIGGFLALTSCLLSTSYAAATKNTIQGERVAALYVKDNSNGELRFLGTGLNSNAQINQLITQKQDMLEQLRPTGTGTTNWGTGTGTGGGTLTGTGTGSLTGTGSGQFAGLGGSGVTPIIISGGGNGGGAVGGGGGGGGGGFGGAITGASPIADLLPQIIGQAVVGGSTRRGGANQRRRAVNKRRGNRRPARRGNKKRPQIFVVRPRN